MAEPISKKVFQKKQKPFLLDFFIKLFLFLAIFCVPLFFYPNTTDIFEFNKLLLFGFFVLLSSLLFLLKVLMRKEVAVVCTFVDIPLVIFVILVILSTIFSINVYQSIVGVSAYVSDSLAAILFFIIFFFVSMYMLRSMKEIWQALGALFASSTLLVVFNLLQIFKLYILPFDITKTSSFNLLGNSTGTLALFVALTCLIIFVAMFFVQKRWLKIVLPIMFILHLVLLLFIDKSIGWYGIILGSFLVLIFFALRSQAIKHYVIIAPTVLLSVAIIVLFLNASALFKTQLPNDIILDQRSTWGVVVETLKQRPLLGTGPETFNYNFERYRTVDFNNSVIWNLRFLKGSNQWFQYLATIGILPTLALLVLCIWYLVNSLRAIFSQRLVDLRSITSVALFVAWLTLFILSFLYPLNFPIQLLFWLFLSLGMNAVPRQRVRSVTHSLQSKPLATLAASLITIVLLLVTAAFFYFGGRFWVANVEFVKALKARDNVEDLSVVKGLLDRTLRLNPYQADYHFVMAQALATESKVEALKSDADIQKIQGIVQQAVNETNAGVSRDSKNPLSYENQALIYDSLRGIVSNADEQMVVAYTNALQYEPNNPVLLLNMGRARSRVAQITLAKQDRTAEEEQKAKEFLQQALADFDKAQSLKTNFPDARLQKAFVYELQGDKEKAIAEAKSLSEAYPQSVDILYELAELYRRSDDQDNALAMYQRVIQLQSDHTNAHWQAGLIYEQKGDKEEALTEFKTVLELNPNNEQVKQKVEELQK